MWEQPGEEAIGSGDVCTLLPKQGYNRHYSLELTLPPAGGSRKRGGVGVSLVARDLSRRNKTTTEEAQ